MKDPTCSRFVGSVGERGVDAEGIVCSGREMRRRGAEDLKVRVKVLRRVAIFFFEGTVGVVIYGDGKEREKRIA